jgi:hypothetical protein
VLRRRFGIATGAYVGERDDWSRATARAAAEGWRTVELTAMTEASFGSLVEHVETCGLPSSFERVSVHAPAVFETSAGEVVPRLASSLGGFDLVLHPDRYGAEDGCAALSSRAVFENMDSNKPFGRTVADLALVFDRFPEAGFCLDVAHVWTNDETLRLGFDLLDAFGGRLRQLHVSGIEPDGTHRPTTPDDLRLYEPLLARCTRVPWVLEAELEAHADLALDETG